MADTRSNLRTTPYLVRAGRRIWIAFVLLVVSGCGLSSYEKKMIEEQQRIKNQDDENRLLGKAVVFPQRNPEKPGDPPPIPPLLYFRPPRAIDSNAREQIPGLLYLLPLAGATTQPGPGASTAPAPAGNPPAKEDIGLQAIFLGYAVKKPREEFMREVSKGFGGDLELANLKQTPIQPHGQREQLMYYFVPLRVATAVYLFYFYSKGDYQAAVILQVENGKEDRCRASDAVRFSLQSLAIGPDSQQVRGRGGNPAPMSSAR